MSKEELPMTHFEQAKRAAEARWEEATAYAETKTDVFGIVRLVERGIHYRHVLKADEIRDYFLIKADSPDKLPERFRADFNDGHVTHDDSTSTVESSKELAQHVLPGVLAISPTEVELVTEAFRAGRCNRAAPNPPVPPLTGREDRLIITAHQRGLDRQEMCYTPSMFEPQERV